MNDFPEFMRHPYNKIYAKSVIWCRGWKDMFSTGPMAAR